MEEESAFTPQILRALAELKGLDLSEELLEKLAPLVRDLLVMANSLTKSDIWQSESDNPLLAFSGEQ
jgi:hypothetical protein